MSHILVQTYITHNFWSEIFVLSFKNQRLTANCLPLKARGGSWINFARLAHMNVPFIAEQPLFTEQPYCAVSKVIKLLRSAVGLLPYRNKLNEFDQKFVSLVHVFLTLE